MMGFALALGADGINQCLEEYAEYGDYVRWRKVCRLLDVRLHETTVKMISSLYKNLSYYPSNHKHVITMIKFLVEDGFYILNREGRLATAEWLVGMATDPATPSQTRPLILAALCSFGISKRCSEM